MGTLLWIGILLLLAYAGLVLLVYWQQRAMVYFPAMTRVDPRDTDFGVERDDATLRGWVLQPDRRDALLYFGGNAESIEANRHDLLAALPEHAIYLLAYRGYGASDGSPTQALLFEDALALYDAVRLRHPGAEISVIGRSLGSGVASHLASRRPVSRLVLVTPFDSLARVAQSHYRYLPVALLMHDRFESSQALRLHRGDVLVLRAARDQIIPAASTDRLIASLPEPPGVVTIDGAGHNDLSMDPLYWSSIAGFLAAGPASPPADS